MTNTTHRTTTNIIYPFLMLLLKLFSLFSKRDIRYIIIPKIFQCLAYTTYWPNTKASLYWTLPSLASLSTTVTTIGKGPPPCGHLPIRTATPPRNHSAKLWMGTPSPCISDHRPSTLPFGEDTGRSFLRFTNSGVKNVICKFSYLFNFNKVGTSVLCDTTQGESHDTRK